MLFWILVVLIGIQRLIELSVSRSNQRRLIKQGAHLISDDGYYRLVFVHSAWFLGMGLEYSLADWAGTWDGTQALLGTYAVAETVRLWAIVTLGKRWTTRVVVLPDVSPIEYGPYRWLRHPNYIAVFIEMLALPSAFGLPVAANLVALGKIAALRKRIRVEEATLYYTTEDENNSIIT